MKRIFSCILIFCIFILFSFTIQSKSFNMNINFNKNKAFKGENILLNVSPIADYNTNLATFRMKLSFDNSKLQFKSIQAMGSSLTKEYKYSLNNNELIIIYISNENYQVLEPNVAKDLFSIKFHVLNDCDLGSCIVNAEFDGIADNSINELTPPLNYNASINIVNEPENNCKLKSLSTSYGNISPSFSPYITEYNLDVPYEINKVETYAEAEEPSTAVKINRKRLKAGGSTTEINITLTSADKKDKNKYTIYVHRGTKNTKTSTTSNKVSSRTSRKNSSNSTSSNKLTNLNRIDNANNKDENVDSILPINIDKNALYAFLFGVLIATIIAILCYYLFFNNNRHEKKHTAKKVDNSKHKEHINKK